MKLLSLLLSLSLLPSVLSAGQSEISVRMKSLADGLVTSYRAKHPAGAKEKIAIFEFNSTKELREKRVGHAVAELLTHHVNGESGFVLVERLELNKIMEELKLSMAGVTDQEDALKAGKLGGAKAVVLGSVEKFGDKYHVNARLVDVETGEVSATAYESMPVGVFEAEAKDYIVLVPDSQRIGIYALFNWRHSPNDLPVDSTDDSNVYPRPFDIGMVGLGLRYAPSRRLLIDVGYMANSTTPSAGRDETTLFGSTSESYGVSVKAFRGLAGYRLEFGKGFFAYPSVGVTYYQISSGMSASYLTPTAQLRGEYSLQERVGLSLAATADFLDKIATGASAYYKQKRDMCKLGKTYVETSVSVYF